MKHGIAKYGLLLTTLFYSCSEPLPVVPVESGTVPSYQWVTSSLAEQSVDSLRIDSATVQFSQDEQFYSMVLVRNGLLVKEYYHPSMRSFHEFELRSATKSVVSVLTGIALEHRLIDSLDEPVISFFPEYDSPSLDIRSRSITVRHLLTMRAGFDYSDNDPKPELYTDADNWVRRTIELPLKYNPGERFTYASVQTHLLSAIITRRSGMSTLDFAKRYLFGPLGIRAGRWDRDPQGICFGGSGLTMTPRDMARFGEMVRREGGTEHDTIVSASWIRSSQQPNNAVNSVWSDFTERNYGFSWWTNRSGADSIFFAAGSGGQFIVIVPSKNAVIVTTANPNQATAVVEAQEERVIRIIARYILPALR